MPEIQDQFVLTMTEYAKQEDPEVSDEPELIIPEDLSALSSEELTELHEQAAANFDALYGDGTGLTQDDLGTLGAITDGIETLITEAAKREEAQAERNATAEKLAKRAGFVKKPEEEPQVEEEDEEERRKVVVAASVDEGEAETLATRKEIRVNLAALSRRQTPPATEGRTMKDLVKVADVPGFSVGEGLDWIGVGKAVDRRLTSFNQGQYAAANRNGSHLREQHGVAVIRKPFEDDLVIRNSDPEHVDTVMRRAMNEHRLPGGSLVASGGWCAPSETIYDLFEIESRDGLFSIPEIGIARGGINFTPGPDFASIYNGAPGWNFTEADDIAGDYTAGVATGGTKPVYKVPCPAFTEKRLDAAGLAITAGLLQSRGYPEVIARTVRGALVAHDHRLSGLLLAGVEAQSTPVAMTIDQVGTIAPLLDAIELQVEHYRYVHRLARGTTLEAVFPYWVHGAVRSDLSRRLGVDLINVSDAVIDGWFSLRGISPQYVYNWQDLAGAAGSFKAWPSSVKFLLYVAGTWVRGASDIITLDTLYDSVLLGTNDFTALWTEEGWLLAKMGHDSRCVSVPISSTGLTGQGVHIKSNGTEGAPMVPVVLSE